MINELELRVDNCQGGQCFEYGGGFWNVVGDFCWIEVDPGGDSSQIFCKLMIGNNFEIY